MEVFNPNGINIYNLSGGKSLPDFLSERKRKDMLRKDVKLRRRIELIQDFDMPTVCTRICPTKDGQHIYIAGTYKPRKVYKKYFSYRDRIVRSGILFFCPEESSNALLVRNFTSNLDQKAHSDNFNQNQF